ncbi:hypothetical protein RTBOTA2_006417 [Rhodotorula toruloides]|uniref:Uncharacterized protein n=1 Tax=Rhodotorula toruloides TaxID=5286 RepID=A0A0K3CTU0_RHOTO|nr:hypothetical protein RTBOTA2_006417 [Rhodotorula toruloides]PRQ70662.1 hypothetical protein AAT19DRAFT_10819 [Rhodotorula toruloides]
MSAPPAQPKPIKPPKLKLDTKYGPHPNLEGKYRTAQDFKQMYRAYQWTQGYDAMVAIDTPQQCRLICNDGGGCPFNILAQYTTFTEPPLTGQSGFFVSPTGFQPKHNHPAPYIPMNVAAENERRKTLMHGEHSLEHPPLQRALGFSGSVTSTGSARDAAAAPGGFADGASVASTPSFAPQQLPFRQSQAPQAQTQAQPMPSPGAAYQQQQGVGLVNGMHQGSPPNSVGQYGSPAPPYQQPSQPPPASQIYGTAQSQYAPFSQTPMPYGMQQSHPPTMNGYSSASPAPPSQAFTSHPSVGRKPLEAFLLSISPQFEPYLGLFERNNIPLDTLPQDLLDLDSGKDEDRTLFDVFKDVKQMPLFYVALAADGVRKAKKRQLMSGSREVDPRIAVGLEKANAERWVRAKIEEGHRRLQEQQQMQQVARL